MRRRSVRLHLVESSTASSTETETAPSAWTDGEPPAPPLPLSIALRGLVAEAEAQHDRVDFADLVNVAESPQLPRVLDGHHQWKRVERSPNFTLLKREAEVLALARLDASVEEIASVLGGTTNQAHTATMTGLYRDAFIAGTVAYVQRPHDYEDEQLFQQLSVKTSSFVHSDLWGKNEQWCFAETLRCNLEDGSFTLTQASLSETQAQSLPARLALNRTKLRVAQLRDVTAAYSVERTPGHNVRVAFHALHQPASRGENGAPTVSPKAARARLLRLARGVSELSQVVRRRRFGAQVLADRSAFDVRNPRCTCCTRRLTPFQFVPKTRCYLCGYYVCVACSSSEKMETHFGRLASIIACTRCVKSVVACDYEHMLSVRPGPELVVSDELAQSACSSSFSTLSTSSEASRLPSSLTESSSSQKLGELLTQVVTGDAEDVTTGRRRAAFLVLEQLLLDEQKETQVTVDQNAKLLRTATASLYTVDAAKRALEVSTFPSDPAACTFASSCSRPYPMLPALVGPEAPEDPSEPIVYPIPENEAVRLAAIEHFRLHDVANVAELNVICTLAAAEMGCPHSVLTLVERDVVTLLATNAPENWDVGSGNPREQTFCQHFVMDDQPLLVRHAESDMRFYHIAPVVLRSLRFYAGFPVTVSVANPAQGGREKVVVGALCCLDAKPHEMTRSQYWRLMKLAQAASIILERNAKESLETCSQGAQPRAAKTSAAAAVAC
jgi:hypothetical protein